MPPPRNTADPPSSFTSCMLASSKSETFPRLTFCVEHLLERACSRLTTVAVSMAKGLRSHLLKATTWRLRPRPRPVPEAARPRRSPRIQSLECDQALIASAKMTLEDALNTLEPCKATAGTPAVTPAAPQRRGCRQRDKHRQPRNHSSKERLCVATWSGNGRRDRIYS